MRIAKLRNAGNGSLSDIKNQLRELWEVTVCNIFPPTMSSALSQFHPQIRLEKLATEPSEWPQSSSIECLDPFMMDAMLSQLILQRDFALGLLGSTSATVSDMLNFLASDATFLRSLQSLLASPSPFPLQPTSCMPSLIRNLIASEPLFLEIMLELLLPFQDEQFAAVPHRISQGAQLCHILQYSFGFDSQDLQPLYLRLISNPMSSISGPKHSGEFRAVTESPPQRYNLKGEPQGMPRSPKPETPNPKPGYPKVASRSIAWMTKKTRASPACTDVLVPIVRFFVVITGVVVEGQTKTTSHASIQGLLPRCGVWDCNVLRRILWPFVSALQTATCLCLPMRCAPNVV